MHPFDQLAPLRSTFAAFAFVFGTVFGSFLNVVIYRLPRGLSVVRPRSACPSCGHMIAWYDNVPIVSWLVLRGRCRRCKTPISARYAAVELLTGLLFLAVFLRHGFRVDTLAGFVLCAGLVAITFIDLQTYTIPYAISLPVTAVGLLTSRWSSYVTPVESVAGMAAGALLVVLIVALWWVLFRKIGMGMGDAALLALIGSYLGYQSIAIVLFLGSIQGLVVALPLFLLGRTDRLAEIDKYDPLHPAHAGPPPEGTPGGGEVADREAHAPAAEGEAAPPAPAADTPADAPPTAPGDAGESGDPAFRQAVIMFGPFLALSAIEYYFFRDTLQGLFRGLSLLTGR